MTLAPMTEALNTIGQPCRVRSRHTQLYFDGWITPSGYAHILIGKGITVIEPHLVETDDHKGLFLSRTAVAENVIEGIIQPAEIVYQSDWITTSTDTLSCIVDSKTKIEDLQTYLSVEFKEGTAHKTRITAITL